MSRRKLKQATLQYHTEPGAGPKTTTEERLGFRPELDDPLSPGFLTLAERDALGQARFWAMREKRKDKRGNTGVFDG